MVGYEQARVNTRTEQPKTVIRYNSHGLLSHIVTLFGYLRLVLFIYLFVYLFIYFLLLMPKTSYALKIETNACKKTNFLIAGKNFWHLQAVIL